MRSTKIVTAFIRDGRRFLIVRRSGKVKTMKGMWAGISGIIENDEEPLSRAKIEIFEELGITEEKIRLVKAAREIRITSPQYRNHEWQVYPFLFSARRPRVTLNWENSEYKWATAEEIVRHKTVPSLADVLLCLL